RSPPTSTLFPYTTLFRSRATQDRLAVVGVAVAVRAAQDRLAVTARAVAVRAAHDRLAVAPVPEPEADLLHVGLAASGDRGREGRSEEHTSELQSRENLVC